MHGNKKKQRTGFTVYKKTRVIWSLLVMPKNTNGLTCYYNKNKKKEQKSMDYCLQNGIFIYKQGEIGLRGEVCLQNGIFRLQRKLYRLTWDSCDTNETLVLQFTFIYIS